jgi:hypothetical protein
MDNLKYCIITLELEFGAVNDQTMTVIVDHNGKQQQICPNTDTVISCNIEVEFPTAITLSLFGKNMNTDTQLNEKHEIIKDKYVKLTNLKIDKISAPLAYLQQKIKFILDDQFIVTNYFGFNGSATIYLDKSNAFTQQCYFIQSLTD